MIVLERMIPVSPPIVNMIRNPIDQRMDGEFFLNLFRVVSHLKILIPVGTAMIMVVVMK